MLALVLVVFPATFKGRGTWFRISSSDLKSVLNACAERKSMIAGGNACDNLFKKEK